MSGQYAAAVFYAEGALEERLDKVAPRAEHHHDKPQAHPLQDCQAAFRVESRFVTPDEERHHKHDYSTAYRTLPTLAGRNSRKELMPAEKRAAAISTRVVGPKKYEHTERNQIVVDNRAVGRGVKGQNVYR